ncbi:hypothetical protein ATN84_16145 [Paramesorhizobium deserti]|uniref:Intradiol ring-cleavage dioxygenases domain-containing protein n=1 Tax=Paramesorhizobium deserti TaxID=1494590 RepID=A0A135HTC2_9HYPH|nr:hypothetical protein [Paramesorhizobium deserti]KXF76403.1 hypothetical protein ATN84_16145 [Paramesorhizobium deserti]
MNDIEQGGFPYDLLAADAGHSRRRIVSGALATAVFAMVPMSGWAQAAPAELPRTPHCDDDDAPTIATTEGPFFRPRSPMRRHLSGSELPGRPILIGGFVLDTRCGPLRNVLVDAWQANDDGEYDQRGFQLRGHQWTDDEGRWWFSTIVPAPYGPRTRHIHFKLQQRGGAVLTTQLFFPDEPLNQSDYQYDDKLLLTVSRDSDRLFGRFDFVL